MQFRPKLISLFVCIIAVILGLLLYEEQIDSYEAEFSNNLKNWFQKGKYIDYKNFKIFYVHEELNNGEKINGTTILFLHGFPTSSYDYYRVWNLFLKENQLDRKYVSLITFDHLGYGFSDKPLNYNYTIIDKADMVQFILAKFNIKSVVLIAHDMSDSVALELIRRENSKDLNMFKIEKCILMNGGIITSTLRPILSQQILRTKILKNIYVKLIKWITFRYGDFKTIFGDLKPPNEEELYDFYLTIKYNNGFLVLPLTIEYMNERERLNDVWYKNLNETDVPVMFIYGPADPINPNNLFPKKLLNDIHNIRLKVLSDLIGHYPQFEDPFTVFQLIQNFIN